MGYFRENASIECAFRRSRVVRGGWLCLGPMGSTGCVVYSVSVYIFVANVIVSLVCPMHCNNCHCSPVCCRTVSVRFGLSMEVHSLCVRTKFVCLPIRTHFRSEPTIKSCQVHTIHPVSILTTMNEHKKSMSFFRHKLGNLFSISSKIIVHHDAWVWSILCGAVVWLTHFGGKFV